MSRVSVGREGGREGGRDGEQQYHASRTGKYGAWLSPSHPPGGHSRPYCLWPSIASLPSYCHVILLRHFFTAPLKPPGRTRAL